MPLYCIRSLANGDRETKRGRTLHRIKSRPQATRLRFDRTRLAAHSCSPDRVVTFEELPSREKFNPNRPVAFQTRNSTQNSARTVSNKQKCIENDNGRGPESRWKEIGFAAMWGFRVEFSVKFRGKSREKESYIRSGIWIFNFFILIRIEWYGFSRYDNIRFTATRKDFTLFYSKLALYDCSTYRSNPMAGNKTRKVRGERRARKLLGAWPKFLVCRLRAHNVAQPVLVSSNFGVSFVAAWTHPHAPLQCWSE